MTSLIPPVGKLDGRWSCIGNAGNDDPMCRLARVPMLAALTGMTTAFTSVVFYFGEDDFRRPLGVAVGFGFVLLAIWYAAHPFIKNERDYPELRKEVVEFIDLARQLHYAAMLGDNDAFESIETRMPAQAMVVEAARKSLPSDAAEDARIARVAG